jgi:hypothetical protein
MPTSGKGIHVARLLSLKGEKYCTDNIVKEIPKSKIREANT